MAAFAVHRFRFFGRELISFVLVLPLALPGIITGIALTSLFNFASVTKDKSRSVCQAKDERHRYDPAHFILKCGSEVRLDEGAKEKFFD